MVTSKLHRFRINKLRLFVSGAATVKVELFKKKNINSKQKSCFIDSFLEVSFLFS